MITVTTVKDLQRELAAAKANAANAEVGYVPTMGALHAGHLSLIERCRRENGIVVATVFVNPTQFNDPKDLVTYPRTPQADAALLASAGCDILFMPPVEEVYPQEDTRHFDFGELERVMEGACRPGHFNGVAQVVSRFFDLIRPDRAYFGEKDFQQLAIIRRMVKDLGLPVQIVGCPILREESGLALSSRNMLLSPEHRVKAASIYAILRRAAELRGVKSVAELQQWVKEELEGMGEFEVEYFLVVNARTLQPVASWSDPGAKQGCIALRIGGIRLIDNITLS